MKKWQQTYGHNSVKSSRSPRKFHSKICNNVVVVRGLQCPKNAPRSQNFKIFTILRGYCAQTLYASSSEPISFCTPRGPLVIPSMQLRAAPKILAPGPPWAAHTQKSFPQIFQKSSGWGPNFRARYTGTPRPTRDKILATVPRPTSSEKNYEISLKIDNFSS